MSESALTHRANANKNYLVLEVRAQQVRHGMNYQQRIGR